MAFFEETAQLIQPFAAVDHPPVISYAEMEASFDNLVDEVNRRLAPDIYEHWKARRTKLGNRPLKTTLKVRIEISCCCKFFRLSRVHMTDTTPIFFFFRCSMKPVKTQTTQIHMSAFVGEKFDKFERLAVGTPRAQRSSENCARSLKMLESCLRWFDNERPRVRNSFLWRSNCSSSAARSRR